MKCKFCSKELNLGQKYTTGKPEWYGSYFLGRMVSVICAKCMQIPGRKQKWEEPIAHNLLSASSSLQAIHGGKQLGVG